MKFIFNVVETSTASVAVDADSYEAAKELVSQGYEDGMIEFGVLDVEFNSAIEPAIHLDNNDVTLLLKDNAIILLSHIEKGYKFKYKTPNANKQYPSGEFECSIDGFEKALPSILKTLGIKEDDIVAKYNGNVAFELMDAMPL